MRFWAHLFIIFYSAFGALKAWGEPPPGAQLSLKNRHEVAAPLGYFEFCQSHTSFCKSFSASAGHQVVDGKVVFTPKAWAELNNVNSSVNKSMEAVTDWAQYGKKDLWVLNPISRKGDCEDYVLTKIYALLQKGWPSSALLITLVINPKGQEHAILLVRTTQGDLVLDNMSQSVTPWNQRNYVYLKSQSPENPKVWIQLN